MFLNSDQVSPVSSASGRRSSSRIVRGAFVALSLGAMTALTACGGASDGGGDDTSAVTDSATPVNFVAYSTPKVVYDEIVPAFSKSAAGRDVQVRSSFGASGDQSRAVAAGQRADLVSFSVEPDVTRLVKKQLVAPDWKSGPNRGRINTSLVTFIVRKGNPKNIRTWADLLKPDVEVLTPNPLTSGAAKWNLLAAYGQASDRGRNPKAGLEYLRRLLTERVKVQDKSGREALQNFLAGNGDVLLSYEYEATTARRQGEQVDYVTPDDTIEIDITIAPTVKASPESGAFLTYLLSEPAQAVFASWGYRPVNAAVLRANARRFPQPSGLFTIDDLGGWERIDAKLFDAQDGAVTKIENDKNAGR